MRYSSGTNLNCVTGRTAIETFWGDFIATGGVVTIVDSEAYAHGDVGYKLGAFTMIDSGGVLLDEGKYIELWRHVDDRWQMDRDIWNSNLPIAEEVVEAE
jgi:hypothetical protein